MDGNEARRWTVHIRMSDPGQHRDAVSRLPSDAAGLVRVVQGLLIHGEELDAYDVAVPGGRDLRRTTPPAAERLGEILADDARPLEEPRVPAALSVGTCRDFALLLCCFLRCSFADYLGAGGHDHWICECRDASRAGWRIGDAQMDGVLRARSTTAFDPADVPRSRFRTAGEAWWLWRREGADPALYGHGTTTGPWFLKVGVIRDHLALRGCETSAWDGWRDAPAALRTVVAEETDALDRLAAEPVSPSSGSWPVPPWCEGVESPLAPRG